VVDKVWRASRPEAGGAREGEVDRRIQYKRIVSIIMEDAALELNRTIAERVRELRGARRLSLEALAEESGVSRSMISVIERGESSATAVTLARLSGALGVTLPDLFNAPGAGRAGSPVARRDEQPQWRDPASGYVRRNVSPSGARQPMQITEVRCPAGARVAFENTAGEKRVYQQVWVIKGVIDITVGETRHRLREGDCLAMELDEPTMFHNPTRSAARYAVVIASESGGHR
jgi:transcriptional regulator with XRE-family HTH domain